MAVASLRFEDRLDEAWELFNSLTEKDSGIHVELGDDAKYAVKGEGTILFQLESSGSLEAQDVLYVPVTEDEEQEALKGEQRSEASSSGSQPSGGEEELAPSSSVRRPRWFMQTLKDAQEHVEAPRSTVRESRPPKKVSKLYGANE
jgi:hypothetical protein